MTTVSEKPITTGRVVDARALLCPGTLVEAGKGIGSIAVGEILEIWCSDSSVKTRMFSWCKDIGHKFIGFMLDDGFERLFIRRLK